MIPPTVRAWVEGNATSIRIRLVRATHTFVISVFLLSLQALAADYQWENGPGYRRAKLRPAGTGTDGFTLLSPEQTGIFFTNSLS